MDRQSPALRESLWDLISEIKQEKGVLSPVTVIGPSQYANLSLRQELGRTGYVNVRFIVLPMLSEMLGGAAMALSARRPLTPVLESVLVRRIVQQADGPLAAVSDHKSTLASVRRSFRELRRLSDTALQKLEDTGGVRREVVKLFRIYRQQTANGWYDQEDLADAAAQAVMTQAAPALPDLGNIVLYLPRDLSPAQVRLVGALSLVGSCQVILGSTGDELADSPVADLADSLRPALGQPRRVQTEVGPAVLATGNARIHVAPDAHEELRRVIRQIVSKAEAGIPLHRMAVLYGMDPPYGSIVRGELDLAGISMAGPVQKTLGDTATGRTLTGILRLASTMKTENELRRDEVMAWLTGCPIRRPRNLKGQNFSPSRWEAISRKAGVIRGISQWRNRLNSFAEWMEESASREHEEISQSQAEHMSSDAAAARATLGFVEQLATDVTLEQSTGTWGYFCDWAKGLMQKYLRRNVLKAGGREDGEAERIVAEESEAREKILRVLADLKAADLVEQETSLPEFRRVLEDSLESPVGHLGVTGRGVFVSSISGAVGMDFDDIWIVGMIEGAVPPRIHDDPLLPEALWREAGGSSRLEERVSRERYDFLSAVSASRCRVVSYPVTNPDSRREGFPSRWLLEQAGELAGKTVYADELPGFLDQGWISISPSLENSIASTVSPADAHDYNLQRLLRWRNEGGAVSAHPLSLHGPLAGPVRLYQKRASAELSEFDGNLSHAFADGGFLTELQHSPVSATSLERWAVCPFRYFLSNVLRLGALEEPEETITITAIASGLLIHRILEQFVRESEVSGQMPGAGQPWNATDKRRLSTIAHSLFDDFGSRGLTGKPLLWEMKKRAIMSDLSEFLDQDATLREQYGTSHILAEARFGPGAAWPEAVDDETGIHFRGFIDRVDLGADDEPLLIIDYKTGRPDFYKGLEKDPIDGGRHLQLGVYSLAAQHLPGSKNVRAIYWFPTSEGRFSTVPSEPIDIGNAGVLKRFREGISAIVDGIQGGVFPANPGAGATQDGTPSNCSYCDFTTLCPSRRQQLWQLKMNDNLLTKYRALSDAVVESSSKGGEEGS